MRLSLMVTVLLGLAAPVAQAQTTLVSPDGSPAPQPYQRWVQQAKVPTPEGRIELTLTSCPWVPARDCALPGPPVAIWVDWRRSGRRLALLHEVGHAFDYVHMDAWERGTFKAIVRDPRPGWRSGANSPHERFAEAWAACARHRSIRGYVDPDHFGDWRPRADFDYDYQPSRRQHAKVCALIRRAAG